MAPSDDLNPGYLVRAGSMLYTLVDPELGHELRRAREAREVRESEAIDLDALAAQAEQGDASEWRLRLGRIARALGLLRD